MVRRRKRKNWISWFIILVLLVVAGCVCWLVWDNYFKEETTEEIEDKVEVVQEKEKEDEVESVVESEKKEEIIQYDGDNPNELNELTGAITYTGVSDDKLIVRMNIDQFLADGTCKLSLISNGETIYDETVGIIGEASTATCEGFDISTANFNGGDYDVVIRVSSGDKNGTINGKVSI